MTVWYYPPTNEVVIVKADPAMGWYIVDWGNQKDIYEPYYLKHLGFVELGKLD